MKEIFTKELNLNENPRTLCVKSNNEKRETHLNSNLKFFVSMGRWELAISHHSICIGDEKACKQYILSVKILSSKIVCAARASSAARAKTILSCVCFEFLNFRTL